MSIFLLGNTIKETKNLIHYRQKSSGTTPVKKVMRSNIVWGNRTKCLGCFLSSRVHYWLGRTIRHIKRKKIIDLFTYAVAPRL